MIQKLFSFYTNPDNDCNLHVEVSACHIACWCTDSAGEMQAFEYFTIPEIYKNADEVLGEVKERSILLNNPFAATELVWENDAFTCIPSQYFSDELAMQMLREKSSNAYEKQFSTKNKNLVVGYAVDSALLQAVQEILPNATQLHKVNKLAADSRKLPESYLRLVFYQQHFLLLAVQNNNLQVATSYTFKTPKDILYHVLNALEKYNMPASETPVIAEGFIDNNSALYKKLHQYLGALQLAAQGLVNDKYPAHYFTPFYK